MGEASNLKEVADYEAEKKSLEEQKKDEEAKVLEKVIASVPLASCLKKYAEPATITDWMSPATGKRGVCYQSTALAVNNASADAAMNWLFAHLEDKNINDPLDAPKPAAAEANPEAVMILTSMGFAPEQIKFGLKKCDNNTERVADWLFTNSATVDQMIADELAQEKAAQDAPKPAECSDGKGNYTLFGIVSHVGRNCACGHYVCHLRKGKEWFFFNDEKVAK